MRTLKVELVEEGIEAIALFGSYAREKENIYSDIDIAVKKRADFVERYGPYGYFELSRSSKSGFREDSAAEWISSTSMPPPLSKDTSKKSLSMSDTDKALQGLEKIVKKNHFHRRFRSDTGNRAPFPIFEIRKRKRPVSALPPQAGRGGQHSTLLPGSIM